MKRAILVNGVPASGKSTVAQGIAARRGCPLMVLASLKEPLYAAFGVGDRAHNRALGRAAYAALFAALADWPDPSLVVIDAWFGFQPLDALDAHLRAAGIGAVAEVWCRAPAEALAARYRARVPFRHAGHPGEDYVPELVALSARAEPTGRGPVFVVDTTAPLDEAALGSWLDGVLSGGG